MEIVQALNGAAGDGVLQLGVTEKLGPQFILPRTLLLQAGGEAGGVCVVNVLLCYGSAPVEQKEVTTITEQIAGAQEQAAARAGLKLLFGAVEAVATVAPGLEV